jgi:hypothetical protein
LHAQYAPASACAQPRSENLTIPHIAVAIIVHENLLKPVIAGVKIGHQNLTKPNISAAMQKMQKPKGAHVRGSELLSNRKVADAIAC